MKNCKKIKNFCFIEDKEFQIDMKSLDALAFVLFSLFKIYKSNYSLVL